MADVSACRCGHQTLHHAPGGGRCYGSALTPEGYGGLGVPYCKCPTLDDAILPVPGEPIVFGVHRLLTTESKWTTESDAEREHRFREWIKGAPGDAT